MIRHRTLILHTCVALTLAAILCLFAFRLRPVHFTETYTLAWAARSAASTAVAEKPALPAAAASGVSAAPSPSAAARVNVNTADKAALCAISGIGPALADKIIRERETNGRFSYPEDLLSVNGIGQKTLRKLLNQLELN